MATTTQHAPGTFCWPELSTTDQEGAKRFYAGLFGWEMSDSPIGPGEYYTMLRLAGRDVGALYTMRPEQRSARVPAHWGSYVAVEDADQAVAHARQLGGRVLMEPFDVMGSIGRMAVLQDPSGAIVSVWQARQHAGVGVLNEVGALCWTQLLTLDTEKARAFYSGLFGWKAEVLQMPEGPYTVFNRGDVPAAGMLGMPDAAQAPPHWLPYFQVADCDAVAAKAVALGGQLCVKPSDIAGVGRFAVLADPQGAFFAILKAA